jgi:hypothetical protein
MNLSALQYLVLDEADLLFEINRVRKRRPAAPSALTLGRGR